jgi:hypothetical protein
MKNYLTDFRISVRFYTDRQTDREKTVKKDSDINWRLSKKWTVTQNCQMSQKLTLFLDAKINILV